MSIELVECGKCKNIEWLFVSDEEENQTEGIVDANKPILITKYRRQCLSCGAIYQKK